MQNHSTITTPENEQTNQKTITVVGVGGAGGNIINHLKHFTTHPLKTILLNTDQTSLQSSKADTTILLGEKKMKGLGTNGDVELGRHSAIESKEAIQEALVASDVVFIITGLGGGTGTGASVVVAEEAKALGARVIAIATTPFAFEGKKRAALAEVGIEELKEVVDNIIVLHNNDLKSHLQTTGKKHNLLEAFGAMDRAIAGSIHAISNLILSEGLITITYDELQTILQIGKTISITSGEGSGESRGKDALNMALQDSFLSVDIKDAKGMIIHVLGGSDFSYDDIDALSEELFRYFPSTDDYPKTVLNATLPTTPELTGKIRVELVLVG